jgi:hypothetical protein
MGKYITLRSIRPPLIMTLFLFLTFSVRAKENKVDPKKSEKPREELLVVQTVSRDRKSFVVAKGVKDGILKGMEIIYGNDNVSILCKAREVNRNYSLWAPIDPNVRIPFNKEEIITYNSRAYGNVALDIVADINNLTPEADYDIVYKKFRTQNNYAVKTSLNRALSQSSSDVSNDKNSIRTGYSIAVEYNYRFMPELETSFGGRIDNEVYRINSPHLDIPTNRVMGVVAATYHLTAFSEDENNFYLSVAAGIGKSTTTVSEEKSSGVVTLLPEARIGYIMPFSPSMAMIFEGSIEALSATEKFPNQAEQVTNITNVKFSVGLRF